MKGIKRINVGNTRQTVCIANVIIPRDVGINQYRTKCYRTQTISVFTENGQVLDEVKCVNNLIQHIEFPINKSQLGTSVVLLNIKEHNYPIAISILPKNDHVGITTLGDLSLQKQNNYTDININLNANKRTLSIGNTTQSKAPNFILIDLKSIDLNSVFKIFVTGLVQFVCDLFSIQTKEFNVNVYDDDGNLKSIVESDSQQIHLNADSVLLGKDELQFALKGENTFNELSILNSRITAIENAIINSTVTPSDGGSSFKAGLIQGIHSEKNNVSKEQLLSKKVKTE